MRCLVSHLSSLCQLINRRTLAANTLANQPVSTSSPYLPTLPKLSPLILPSALKRRVSRQGVIFLGEYHPAVNSYLQPESPVNHKRHLKDTAAADSIAYASCSCSNYFCSATDAPASDAEAIQYLERRHSKRARVSSWFPGSSMVPLLAITSSPVLAEHNEPLMAPLSPPFCT